MNSLRLRPKEEKKITRGLPKVSELTIGGGDVDVLFLLNAIRAEIKRKILLKSFTTARVSRIVVTGRAIRRKSRRPWRKVK